MFTPYEFHVNFCFAFDNSVTVVCLNRHIDAFIGHHAALWTLTSCKLELCIK